VVKKCSGKKKGGTGRKKRTAEASLQSTGRKSNLRQGRGDESGDSGGGDEFNREMEKKRRLHPTNTVPGKGHKKPRTGPGEKKKKGKEDQPWKGQSEKALLEGRRHGQAESTGVKGVNRGENHLRNQGNSLERVNPPFLVRGRKKVRSRGEGRFL